MLLSVMWKMPLHMLELINDNYAEAVATVFSLFSVFYMLLLLCLLLSL